MSYPRSRGEGATCTHASIRRARIQGVVGLAFAPVPGVTRVAEVPRPRCEHGPISRPQGLTRTKGTGTGTGTNGNVGNANASTLMLPTTERQTNRHAAAFRSRPEWPSSLSSLQALTSKSMAGTTSRASRRQRPSLPRRFSSLRGALSAVV